MAQIIPLESAARYYRIERTGDPLAPYRLHGKRGAVYTANRQRSKKGVKWTGPMYITDKYGIIRRLVRFQTEWVSDTVYRST